MAWRSSPSITTSQTITAKASATPKIHAAEMVLPRNSMKASDNPAIHTRQDNASKMATFEIWNGLFKIR